MYEPAVIEVGTFRRSDEAAMTSWMEFVDPMAVDERDDDRVLDPTAADPVMGDAAEAPMGAGVQQRARALADRIALEVQDHPLRSLAVAGLVGFLIASSMKYRTIPAMLRSGAGIAAAMALREIAERGLSRLDVGAA